MKERVQGCVTVGVAMMGAGAVALAPMAPQPAVQMRAAEVAKVNLLAETLPTTLQAKLVELGSGVGESGLRLAQSSLQGLLGPIAIAQALGDDEAVKAIIADYIDGPLYVADPTIFALDNVLPAPFGGDTSDTPQYSSGSDVLEFRVQVLYALREAIKDALGVQPATSSFAKAELVAPSPVGDPILTATRLAQGLGQSAQRFVTDSALGLLGPVAIAQALASGDNQGVYDVVESYVDAPLHVADPTIFAIDDVLPKPFGSDPETDPTKMNGSLVSNIRADVLIPARDAIKPGLKNVLGVPKPTTTTIKTVEKPTAELAAADSGPAATTVKKSTVGKHRAPTNNPVSSALKKIAKDVKKATTPKTEKSAAD